jgi:hypothetical protein
MRLRFMQKLALVRYKDENAIAAINAAMTKTKGFLQANHFSRFLPIPNFFPWFPATGSTANLKAESPLHKSKKPSRVHNSDRHDR